MQPSGTDASLNIQPAGTRWRARLEDHVIADSHNALMVGGVVFFPREDVSMEIAGKTSHTQHDPQKGEASFYTLRISSTIAENAAWTFDEPTGAAGSLGGFIAFDPAQVELYPVSEEVANPHHHKDASDRNQHGRDPMQADLDVDEVVKHTDAGDGRSQGERWEPNVEGPQGGLR
ncbi:DUF427 domain-containing protein [Phenylobacterium deserti]|uniref:DUF427 domain-containing protein n=1 Tax=Phenylobacterium deserti TaxID=1914756 RepID=A0A328AQB5_9CAUL|nr:DUF427 domain-containing protein [Phenylobacterium deserti]RAK56777.1 DUF427 domain-containing protein [Phenylobacterium deserti]